MCQVTNSVSYRVKCVSFYLSARTYRYCSLPNSLWIYSKMKSLNFRGPNHIMKKLNKVKRSVPHSGVFFYFVQCYLKHLSYLENWNEIRSKDSLNQSSVFCTRFTLKGIKNDTLREDNFDIVILDFCFDINMSGRKNHNIRTKMSMTHR